MHYGVPPHNLIPNLMRLRHTVDAHIDALLADTHTLSRTHESITQVAFCSAECRKTHWKEGGHKKECKALQSVTTALPAKSKTKGLKRKYRTATSGASRAAAAAADDGGVCTICLESDPPPIQSGCACRGDAGLAHIECRISAAEYQQKLSSSGPSNLLAWTECPTTVSSELPGDDEV
jgi:hypothetical protein